MRVRWPLKPLSDLYPLFIGVTVLATYMFCHVLEYIPLTYLDKFGVIFVTFVSEFCSISFKLSYVLQADCHVLHVVLYHVGRLFTGS